MPITHVCIGTKRGHNHGLVYRPDGCIIGRVKRDSKDAAGTYGHGGPFKRTFYTAELLLGDARLPVPSLGTRHKSRAHAARAIRLFWNWWEHYDTGGVIPAGIDVQAFKYAHRETCALNASPMVRVLRPERAYPRMAA